METEWEDDWENAVISDLLVSIKNKERELKLLEERKLMEDADLILAEKLFNCEQEIMNDESKSLELFVPVRFITKENPKDIKILQEKKRKELQEKQKQQSQKQKEKKQLQQKYKEMYGESEFDEYEELYGHIAEKY
jgi:hypothetical protein